MIKEKNLRVYLVLDPDEAQLVEKILSKLSHGPKMKKIWERLIDAMDRAWEKGARFNTKR